MEMDFAYKEEVYKIINKTTITDKKYKEKDE